MSDALVKAGDKVSLHYKGRFEDGEEFDSSYERNQLMTVVVGSGQLIPGFDQALVGMEVGTVKTVTVNPDQAYGERFEERMAEIPAQNFPEQILGTLQEGSIVPLSNQQQGGMSFPATVLEVTEEFVRVDLNHPLAGKELTFDIEVVRIAEEEE